MGGRLLRAALSIALLTVLTAPLSVAAASDVVRVGRYENPPKVFTDTEGRAVGLFPELLEAVADAEGWTLRWIDCEWATCLDMLADGRLDLMPDVAFSEERARVYDFHAVSVASSWSQVYSAPSRRIATLTELRDLRVAVLDGGIQQSAFEQLMAQAGVPYRELPVASFEAAYGAVVAGRADVVITNTFYAAYNNARFGLRETPIVFLPSTLYFAAPKGMHADLLRSIDRWLGEWRADPDSIYWQALHRALAPTQHTVIPGWMVTAIWVLAIAIVILLALAWLLRRQVRRRTVSLRDSEERNVQLTRMDRLTGLPNRLRYAELFEALLERAPQELDSAALLFLDIDGFASVNESLGHRAGDRVLIELVQRLQSVLGPEDILARTGGDEFAIITQSADDIGLLAQRIIDTSAAPIDLDGRAVHVGLSAGVAVFPVDGTEVEMLQSSADAALQVAKAAGHRSLRFASPEFTRQARERQDLLAGLRAALTGEEFRLYFQPQVAAATGRIVGVECLLRWERPGVGLVTPAEFVAAAEESGLIVAIGEWVLETACAQLRAWSDAGLAPRSVAVNLSAVQLGDLRLTEAVRHALTRHDVPAALLELEITESFVMRDWAQSFGTFEALRSLGVAMSIDDFGTGYSSMRYLQELRVNRLKLDMSFVQHMVHNEADAAIVNAIIVLGHSLGLEVVAEGVETAEQAERLRGFNCDVLQGYHLGRPCDAATMTELLRADRDLQGSAVPETPAT